MIKYKFIYSLIINVFFTGFFIGLSILKAQKYFVTILGEFTWQVVFFGSLLLPIYALFVFIFQYQQGWHPHPIVRKLKLFLNDQCTSWLAVCNEINTEYRQYVFQYNNKFIFYLY